MLTIELTYGAKTAFKGRSFSNLHDAQVAYCFARDKSGHGASKWGFGKVFKDGVQIALISYNGRAWTNDGETLIAEFTN